MAQRHVHVEPSVGQRGADLTIDSDFRGVFGAVGFDQQALGRRVADEHAILEFGDGLDEAIEGRVGLDPGEAVADAVLVL